MRVALVNLPEYCVLRDNPKLRRMVRFAWERCNKTETCKAARVDIRNFYKYIRGNTKEISQMELIRICDQLKITVTIDCEITL